MDEADVVRLVRALAAGAGRAAAPDESVEAVIEAVAGSGAELAATEAEIVTHVARTTLAPGTLRARHLAPLRAAGLDDRAIHDVVHVAACFAYMNRVADGLGVTVAGDERRAWAVRLYGDAALAAHDAWAAGA